MARSNSAIASTPRRGVLVTGSDAFAVGGETPRAVRVCLGPPETRAALAAALERLASALRQEPAPAGVVA